MLSQDSWLGLQESPVSIRSFPQARKGGLAVSDIAGGDCAYRAVTETDARANERPAAVLVSAGVRVLAECALLAGGRGGASSGAAGAVSLVGHKYSPELN